jgi:hypothetical protein
LVKKGSKPEELNKLELTQEIGDCLFIDIADSDINVLAIVQGQKIMLYDAKTLEEMADTPFLTHNPGASGKVDRLALSGCQRILVSIDSDRITVWDTRFFKRAYFWSFFANGPLKCTKLMMTNDMCMFMPARNDPG